MQSLMEWNVFSDIAITLLLFTSCFLLIEKERIITPIIKILKGFTFLYAWFSISKAFYITAKITIITNNQHGIALIFFSFISLVLVSIISFILFTE